MEGTPSSGGLIDSAKRLASSLLGLAHTRVALFAVELQEEKLRAGNLLLWLAVAVVVGSAGLLIALGALAHFLWTWAGYPAVLGLAAACVVAAVLIVAQLRRRLTAGPTPFAATVAEFEKDLRCVRPE